MLLKLCILRLSYNDEGIYNFRIGQHRHKYLKQVKASDKSVDAALFIRIYYVIQISYETRICDRILLQRCEYTY